MFLKKIKADYQNLSKPVRASIWALFCGILQKGVSVITTPIFTRVLSAEEFGRYNVFNSWMAIVSIIVTLNIFYAVFEQGLVKFESEKKEFVSSLQGLALSLTAVWFLIYYCTRSFWNKVLSATTGQMILMFSLIWLSAVFNFWAYEKKNQYEYKALVIVSAAVSLLSPLLSLILIYFCDDNVTARISGIVIVEFVFYIFLFAEHQIKGKCFFSAKHWKYALLFNLPLVPHYLSQVVLSSSDRIMIEYYEGESEAGIYSLAYSLSMIMLVFGTALMQVIGPWLYRKIKSKDIENLSNTVYPLLILVACVNLILIMIAPEAVRIFAPEEYYNSVWIVPPVVISVFFIFCYDVFARFAFYYEKRALITVASIIGALLNIILNYIFINKFGYIAAGYTTLACYMIYALCHYIIMNRVCDKFCGGVRPYNGKIILLISAAFTALGLLMLLTYNSVIIRYSVIGVIAVACLVFSKKIIAFFKNILSLKKAG